MNQILHNKIKEKSKKGKKTKKQRFKVQFIVSVYLIYVTLFAYFLNIEIRNSKEITSKQLADNYNILRLYNNTHSYDSNLYNKDGEEINVKALIYGLTVAINEGIDISNEEKNEKQKPLTQKQVGRMLTQVGLETASQKVANAVIESTKSDEKNE